MSDAIPSQPNEKDLLLATLDLPTLEREPYLKQACRGNRDLQARVEELLRNVEASGSFMGTPAVDLAMTTPMDSICPGSQVDRYRLMEQVGEGGMGVVFVAEQTEPVRRKVALKVIKPGMDTKAVIARFEAERQALAMMDHPNIARVFDAGTTRERLPYFVMELVRGLSITNYCDQAKATIDDRLRLFAEACGAVQHAHQKGIIHRDLKPGNILVTLHDGKPVVKVIDFGVAKALHQQLTEHTIYTALNQVVGTPLYMSPEQLELSGLDIDTRTDVYSLGVLLYELVVGSTPFERERLLKSGFDEMRRIVREEDPPRPSNRVTTIPKAELSTLAEKRGLDQREFQKEIQSELDWIALKALAKDRNRRYNSAAELADDVQRYLNDSPVLACPPSLWYVTSKIARKHRGLLISATLLAIALLAGTAVSIRQAIRATKAEHESASRLQVISAEQSKTRAALVSVQAAETEQRRLRSDADNSANAAKQAAANELQLRKQAEAATHRSQWELYVANLATMQSALKVRHYGRLESLLENSKPADGEHDFRGWEWYYLQQQVEASSQTLPKRSDGRSHTIVAYHPNGSELATFRYPSFIDIWDASSLTWLRRLDCQAPISKMDWSPKGDRIAIGTLGSCNLIVLDSNDGEIVWRSQPLENREGKLSRIYTSTTYIRALSWHRDGERIAIGSRYGDVAIVNLKNKSTTIIHTQEDEGYLGDLDWNPTDDRLAVGRRFGSRMIIDTTTGTKVSLTTHNIEIGYATAWNPSGDLLATSEHEKIRIADRHGQDLGMLLGHTSLIEDLVWIDEHHLVSASRDHSVRVWDWKSQSQVAQYQLFDEPIVSISLRPMSSQIAMASASLIKIADYPSKRENPQIRLSDERGQVSKTVDDRNSVEDLRWSHQGTEVCAAALVTHGPYYGSVNAILSPISLRSLSNSDSGFSKTVSWSQDGRFILRPEVTDALRADDARTGVAIQRIPNPFFDDPIAFYSPSSRLVMTYNDRNPPLLKDGATNKVLRQWPPDIRTGMEAGAWDSSETKFIAAGYGKPALLRTDGTSMPFPDAKSMKSFGVAWHPSSCLMALGNVQGQIFIRDGNTIAVVAQLRGHFGDINGLDFSPDGRRLASASRDGTVRIWDVATGRELLQLTVPGVSGFARVAWSPDGTQLAAGTNDRQVCVFGEVGTRLTPTAAALPTHGTVYQYFQSHFASESFTSEVPLAPWRQPLNSLLKRIDGLRDSTPEAVSRLAGEWLQPSLESTELLDAYWVAALCLVDGYHDDALAITFGEAMLQQLPKHQGILGEEVTLQNEAEARYRILHRLVTSTSESIDEPEFQDQLESARESASRLVDEFPDNVTGLQRRMAVEALATDSSVKWYLDELKRSQEPSGAGHLEDAFAKYAEVVDAIPAEALPFQVPADASHATNEWIDAITHAELNYGAVPTFQEKWVSALSEPVRNGTDNYSPYYLLGLAQLVVNDEAGYLETCSTMLERFAQTQDPLVARFTAWTTCLSPMVISDYEPALSLYERLHSADAMGVELGAILYRMGEHDGALEALSKIADKEQPNTTPAYSWFFLAMVETKLGNADAAQQWLDRANSSLKEQAELAQVDASIAWNRLATLRLLQQEAAQVVQGAAN